MAEDHRCRSCLWFSEPLWPEHRPACLWRPIDTKEPPWVFRRHYVTADDAATCRAWEDGSAPEHGTTPAASSNAMPGDGIKAALPQEESTHG